jgi:diguanylate cyclase (GGDEF)-like protein
MHDTTPAPATPARTRAIRPVRRLALSFAAIALLVFTLWVVYALYTWRTVKDEQAASLRALVDLAARSCDVFFRRQAGELPALAADIRAAGGPGAPAAVRERLIDFQRRTPAFAAIDVLSTGGEVLVSTTAPHGIPSDKPAEHPVFRAEFARVLDHDGVDVGRPFQGTLPGPWTTSLRLRATGADGKPRFVLSALLVLADPRALWQGVALPDGASIVLLRDDGFLQGALPPAPDPAKLYGERQTGRLASLLEREGRPEAGVATDDGDGAQARGLVAFRRLESLPMTACLTLPMDRVLTAWRERVQVTFALFALLLGAVGFAGIWGVRSQRQESTRRDRSEAVLLSREAELERQTLLLQATQRAAGVGGWEFDGASGQLYWTAEMFRIHELTPESYAPDLETALQFFADEARPALRDAVESSLEHGRSWDLELELITATGRRIWTRATGAAQISADGRTVKISGSLQDISGQRAADERIRHMAHYDELTGLANRSLFALQLAHALVRAERYGRRLAVLFVDLDRFKNINDSLGHDMGDEVLRVIARRLVESVRSSDLVARLGGDEFVVLIEELDAPERMAELSRKLLRAIEQPINVREHEFLLSASIGVATYPADGLDTQTLLKHADIAMYRAKEQGKNTFEFFSARLEVPAVDRLSLEARLRRAVMELRQFVLHYQPKVSTLDGSITGVEALVRWSTPEGLVPPGEFIALAEETGLIGTLGSWVLGSACAQASAWRRQGLPGMRVAVNLSARQFYGAHLLDEVREVIQVTGIDPECLELEITESVMMKNVEHVAKLLRSLKDIGVGMSVDDFGTGYSSLAYLKRLPIDRLKIDRSFVRDVPGDPDDAAIARAIIALAHSLRLKVVAEGVETHAQLEFLRALGCDEIQGFLFSRPVGAPEIETLVRRNARLELQPARVSI